MTIALSVVPGASQHIVWVHFALEILLQNPNAEINTPRRNQNNGCCFAGFLGDYAGRRLPIFVAYLGMIFSALGCEKQRGHLWVQGNQNFQHCLDTLLTPVLTPQKRDVLIMILPLIVQIIL